MASYNGVYQNVRSAIMMQLETKQGLKMKPPPPNTRDPNATDLSSMQKKPCSNCGKPGHEKKDCWAKGGGAYKPGKGGHHHPGQMPYRPNPFDDGKGKGKGKKGGKGKGKKGKGKGKKGKEKEGKEEAKEISSPKMNPDMKVTTSVTMASTTRLLRLRR